MKNTYTFYEWLTYACELLNAYEQVIRMTDKYLYTEEIVVYKLYSYHIEYTKYSIGCQVFTTYENAERELPKLAKAFGHDPTKAIIIRDERICTTVIKHRHNRRG